MRSVALGAPHDLRTSLLPAQQAPDRSFQNEGREGVAVLVPPGKYRLTRTVEITSSNVVLRGAGVRHALHCICLPPCCFRAALLCTSWVPGLRVCS